MDSDSALSRPSSQAGAQGFPEPSLGGALNREGLGVLRVGAGCTWPGSLLPPGHQQQALWWRRPQYPSINLRIAHTNIPGCVETAFY